jgi:cytochrome c oxidase subunit 2
MSSIFMDALILALAGPSSRRALLRAGVASVAAIGGAAVLASCAASPPGPRVIKVVARKFDFVPDRIEVAVGETVILEFSAPEVPMGFNLPDLSQRIDIVPGQVARLTLTPTRAGTFVFACDVFCGSGHEDMEGTLVVA